MEKGPKEEDLKGLEQEIESAIDRLFVEKSEGPAQNYFMDTPVTPAPKESEKDLDLELLLEPPAESPPPEASPETYFDKLEAQVLALEWEITEENIKETGEEVSRLKGVFQDNREIVSLLGLMEKALNKMKNDEGIGPSLTRFLLDSKEMLKFLMKGEGGKDEAIYRRLAYEGMEAKFSLLAGSSLRLEGLKAGKKPSPPPSLKDLKAKAVSQPEALERIEEMLNRLNLAVERIDGTLKKMEGDLYQQRQAPPEAMKPVLESKSSPVQVTVFRIDGRLFGVESEKIFKLFKVPATFDRRHLRQERVRLRDFEVRLIDLKKIFSLPKEEQKGEMKILLVKDEEEYKGLLIGQVLKKLSTPLEIGEDFGEYYSGMVHWIYQKRPVTVPVLDLRKM